MNSRIGIGVLVFCVILPIQSLAEDKKPAHLHGTWMLAAYENYGEVKEIPKAEQGTLHFDQGKFRIKDPVLNKEGAYAVDDAKSPKHLDMTWKFKDEVKTMRCIYEVDGDTLRIAQPFDGPKGQRPTEMKSSVHAQIFIYKRQKQ